MARDLAAHHRVVNEHYGRAGLAGAVLAAMREAGLDRGTLTARDLAPLDQIHMGGRAATLALLRLAALPGGGHVLDLGGGIGGPARTLAEEAGHRVTVLDLTAEFCRVGALLTGRTALGGQVAFVRGSALALPFPRASFDAIWMQSMAIHVPDKARLFAEASRVLRPAGRLVLHEGVAGPVGPPHFPTPFAREAAASFLPTADELRAHPLAAGLRQVIWQPEAAPPSPPPAALPSVQQLVWGEAAWREVSANTRRNRAEGRVGGVWGVFERA